MRYFIGGIIITTLFIFCSGCSLIHFLTVKDKKAEDAHSFNAYLNSLNIDTANSFQISCNYINSISMEKFALNTYKLKTGAKASIVQIRFYDRDGQLMNGWEQCFGDLEHFGLLDSVPMKRVTWLPVNYNLTLQRDLSFFKINKEQKKNILDSSAVKDYTILIIYTEWAGWYSKDTFKKVKKYISRNKNSNFLFLKLNLSPDC